MGFCNILLALWYLNCITAVLYITNMLLLPLHLHLKFQVGIDLLISYCNYYSYEVVYIGVPPEY